MMEVCFGKGGRHATDVQNSGINQGVSGRHDQQGIY